MNIIRQAIHRASELSGSAVSRDANGVIRIETRRPQDSSKSNNGGDYYMWTKIWSERGKVFYRECSSCDFWQPMEEPQYLRGVTLREVRKAIAAAGLQYRR